MRQGCRVVACIVGLLGCTREPAGSWERGREESLLVRVPLAGEWADLTLGHPAHPVVGPDARMVTVTASGERVERPISPGAGCIRTGPVQWGGQNEAGAWAVSSGCQLLHVVVSARGTLWDVEEVSPGRARVWSGRPSTASPGADVELRVSLLPRGRVRQAGSSSATKRIELSAVGDAAYAARHGANGLDNALAVVAVANGLLEDGGLDLPIGLVLVRFTMFSRDPYTPAMHNDHEVDVSSLLTNFAQWVTANDGHRDSAVLLSGLDFQGTVRGYGGVGTMCYPSASNAVVQHTFTTAAHGVQVAHQIGHALGMQHDSVNNPCDPTGYVMAALQEGVLPTRFSTCSSQYLEAFRASTGLTCLDNDPMESAQPRCGDGVLADHEECDCGVWCAEDPCCNATTCQFTTGAVCSALDACCDNETCQFRATGQECAPSAGPCDLGGRCSGTSPTCYRTHAPVLTPCEDGTSPTGGRCLGGECHSAATQCAALGAAAGLSLGGCATQPELATCGVLYCTTGGAPEPCFAISYAGDPVRLEDGVACGDTASCLAGTCTPGESPLFDTCPNDPAKTAPGQCGCGTPDTDADQDQTADCVDACPEDPMAHVAPCPTSYAWVTGAWSACSAECDGTRVRPVSCQGDTGVVAPQAACAAEPAPADEESCNPCSYTWSVGSWSACSAECEGQQTRAVVCQDPTGRAVDDGRCTEPKPEEERACQTVPCPADGGVPGSSSSKGSSSSLDDPGASSGLAGSSGDPSTGPSSASSTSGLAGSSGDPSTAPSSASSTSGPTGSSGEPVSGPSSARAASGTHEPSSGEVSDDDQDDAAACHCASTAPVSARAWGPLLFLLVTRFKRRHAGSP